MPEPRAKTPSKIDRRARIASAAERVFAAKGYHDTRVQDIADEAGVAYGLVYHYFGTKDALLATLFDDNWSTFADVVEGIVASDRPVPDQVRAILDYVYGALDAYPDRMRVIFVEYGRQAREGDRFAHPEVARALRALSAAFEAAAARGDLVDGIDATALPLLWMGALQAAIVADLDAEAPPERSPALRTTVRVLLGGAFATPSP